MQEKVIYNLLLYIVFISSIVIFAVLLFIKAPYGRHYRGGWGFSTSAKVGWLAMEFPAVAFMIILFVAGNKTGNIVAMVFLGIWLSHYLHRTFLYPFLMKGGYKRFPVLLILFAVIFNSINSYLNGRYLFYFSNKYPLSWLYDLRFIFGIAVFFSGLVINTHSDSILRGLRGPQSIGYKIPRGGLFKYVSNPNYFGEILEWIGWAILTWSMAGLAFAVFTIANLLPRAISNHKWYKSKFPEYPDDRKIIVPFLY